ncbi:hypothetical protein LDENG_00081860 [Lucifuga dentata]|nr:hypothetical protein LDENG_00081860 [Lucifuga dentata]
MSNCFSKSISSTAGAHAVTPELGEGVVTAAGAVTAIAAPTSSPRPSLLESIHLTSISALHVPVSFSLHHHHHRQHPSLKQHSGNQASCLSSPQKCRFAGQLVFHCPFGG